MEIMTTTDARKEIVEYMTREILGPAPGFPAIQVNKEEMLRPQDPPRLRYSAGILFPMRSEQVGQQDSDEKDLGEFEAGPVEEGGETSIAQGADLVDSGNPIDQQPETDLDLNLANQYLPSAMGLSALIRIPRRLIVKIMAARYEKGDVPGFGRAKSNADSISWAWLRKPLLATVTFDSPELLGKSVINLEKKVEKEGPNSKLAVNVVSRPREEGDLRLVTITLINRNESARASSDELCFFQCRFEVRAIDSTSCFLEYPDHKFAEDAGEKALRFLYRKKKVFAVGHGCACNWLEQSPSGCVSVWTESLPSYELKPIVHVELKDVSLSMRTLSEGGSQALLLYETLARSYADWIAEQKERLLDPVEVPPEFADVAQVNLESCDKCLARILRGIELLRHQPIISRAFQLANEAMYRQQSHYELASTKVRQWVDNKGNLQLQEPYKEPDYARKPAAWRPFQLAFLLMNLESATNADSLDRKIVDLIWFPTGGGKTEAYLGLSAFTIFLRRLRNPGDAGTTVLMRYTLRLLTTQQFQRAASLICACDYIRRSRTGELGTAPISVGLWVGMGVTPNDHQDAVTSLNRLHEYPDENRFVVLACPWCAAEMGPVKSGNHWKVKGYRKLRKPSRVVFQCEDSDCPFSTDPGLPLKVVDEAIYEDPPTLVIGTVDKFAMLPWRPKAGTLFGLRLGYSPPDLIIQDELHLISGPLGSMVAHYETAIDALCCATSDISPKIIASTATISRADEQIAALYGGRSSFLFPPQGLEVGNSFFAEEGVNEPGRCYMGIFASALPSHVTAQIRVISAVLQAAKSIPTKDPQCLDPFWTLMVYFNSIRELGHAATLIHADIREYMNAMWDRQGLTKGVNTGSVAERRFINRNIELTSRVQSNQIPRILAQLFNRFRGDRDYEVVDICLATNMIQVGLDVPRLSLMVVVGQPKTTAEYIQATSRVGRSEPGIVLTIYNPARPRDRSHYEHFRAYHQSIYRFVEPTSVTPFARPVIERALHAVAVALIRMLGGDSLAQRPNAPPPDDELVERIRTVIAKRVSQVDEQEAEAALERLNFVIEEWKRVPPSKYGDFSPPDREEPLMYPSGSERHPAWSVRPLPTPISMRNVDATCDAGVLSTFPEPE
jgi:Helicase conserved C-terminal domain